MSALNILAYKTKLCHIVHKMNKEEVHVVDLNNGYDIKEVDTDGNCFFHSILGSLEHLDKLPPALQKIKNKRKRAHALRMFLCFALEQVFFSPEPKYLQSIKNENAFLNFVQLADLEFSQPQSDFLQSKKDQYEHDDVTLGQICNTMYKDRPLVKTIMDQYLLIEEFTHIKPLFNIMLEAAKNQPEHYIQQEEVNSTSILQEATAISLLTYIHKHSVMGIHVDLLVFGPLVADLFNTKIEFCFLEAGVFHFATHPITPDHVDSTIYIMNHLPYFPHYDYLIPKISKVQPPVVHQITHDEFENLKNEFTHVLPTQISPDIYSLEDLDQLIATRLLPYGTLQTEDMSLAPFILTGKDLGVVHTERRTFMAGQLVFKGCCSQTKNLYYAMRTSNLDIQTQKTSLFSTKPLDSTCYQRISTGVMFHLDPEYHPQHTQLWTDSSMCLYGMSKKSKSILSLKPKGDYISCIFYVRVPADLPEILVLEINPNA